MKNLITINKRQINQETVDTISARELHMFLEVATRFNDWINKRIEDYGFTENRDYVTFTENSVKTHQGRPSTEYHITLDMAKELSMVERNDKGREARQYFIECEKQLKAITTPTTYLEALEALVAKEKERLVLASKNRKLISQITEMKPKADYCDIILQSKGLVTVTQMAKDYGMSGIKFNQVLADLKIQYKQSGQWQLYQVYADKGYTQSTTHPITHKDGTITTRLNTKWTQQGRLFLYNKLKEHGILPLIERNTQKQLTI